MVTRISILSLYLKFTQEGLKTQLLIFTRYDWLLFSSWNRRSIRGSLQRDAIGRESDVTFGTGWIPGGGERLL